MYFTKIVPKPVYHLLCLFAILQCSAITWNKIVIFSVPFVFFLPNGTLNGCSTFFCYIWIAFWNQQVFYYPKMFDKKLFRNWKSTHRIYSVFFWGHHFIVSVHVSTIQSFYLHQHDKFYHWKELFIIYF